MSRRAFFDSIRDSLFGGSMTGHQVQGMDAILDEWIRSGLEDPRWLAYMLATTYHETARTMQPIKEYGSASYFRKMYDIEGDRPHVAKTLGNTRPGDGALFCGRGYVQLTGRSNYSKASGVVGHDLVANPALALEPEIASRIMFHGMKHGWFTGKKLSDYFGVGTDWVQARRIINGLDKANTLADYAVRFHNALLGAKMELRGSDQTEPPRPESPNPLPEEPDDPDAPAHKDEDGWPYALTLAIIGVVGASLALWLAS